MHAHACIYVLPCMCTRDDPHVMQISSRLRTTLQSAVVISWVFGVLGGLLLYRTFDLYIRKVMNDSNRRREATHVMTLLHHYPFLSVAELRRQYRQDADKDNYDVSWTSLEQAIPVPFCLPACLPSQCPTSLNSHLASNRPVFSPDLLTTVPPGLLTTRPSYHRTTRPSHHTTFLPPDLLTTRPSYHTTLLPPTVPRLTILVCGSGAAGSSFTHAHRPADREASRGLHRSVCAGERRLTPSISHGTACMSPYASQRTLVPYCHTFSRGRSACTAPTASICVASAACCTTLRAWLRSAAWSDR